MNPRNLSDFFNASIIDKTKHAAQKLDGVVKDLNMILSARNTEGRPSASFDIIAKLKEVAGKLEREIDSNNVDIRIHSSQPSLFYVTIEEYFTSIIESLLSNALKFVKNDRPKVNIVVHNMHQNKVKVSIIDNGVGIDDNIPESDLFKLYKRFHLEFEGKGMGLYLAQTKAEAIGGRIIYKRNKEQGSCFTLELLNL